MTAVILVRRAGGDLQVTESDNMQTKSTTIACLTAIGLLGATHPIIAQQAELHTASFAEDVGAQERINFSGKLRMLSQRIAASACHFAEGVDPNASSALLAKDTAEFEKILNALEHGDDDLSIKGVEKRRKTLAKIETVKEQWAAMKSSAEAIANGDNSETHLNVVVSSNTELLKKAAILVTELVGQYSNPAEMVQADSMVIDIAGRQRMLSQKISKESCLLASHHENENTRSNLEKSMQVFEASLYALRNGMPSAGVKGPPTKEIAAGLELVNEDWMSVKPTLLEILAGTEVSIDVEADKYHKLNKTMADMNKVVGLYSNFAKRK